MRILIVSQMYPRRDAPTFGEFIHRQARALAAAGNDVTIVAPMMNAPWFTWWNRRWADFRHVALREWRENVNIHRPRYISLPGMRFHYLEGATIRYGILPQLERLHAEKPFDIIHANRLFPEGFASLQLQRRWNIPLAAMARGMDLNLIPKWGRSYRKRLRQVAAEADGILSVSEALLSDLEQFSPRPTYRRVIYNGCDVQAAPPTEQEREETRLAFRLPRNKTLALYVGRLEPDKGTPELLRSFGAAAKRNPDLHLALVGSIRNPSYRSDAVKAGWNDQAHFLGEHSYRDVQRIMRASDFFVFPSRLEGVPNAVLEAMGHGLPVIATKAGGIPEILPAGAGILLEVGDIRRLEESIVELAGQPEKRKSMGEIGRHHVARGFSWGRNAQELLSVYEELRSRRSTEGKEMRVRYEARV